jgi:predicted dehydrogenase
MKRARKPPKEGKSMAQQRLRIGIVGLQPGRSWAARAHVPALRALADDYEIVGVANTSRDSAEAAAATCGIPRAFANVAELVASPEVDIVAVTVKVPHHLQIVKAAIAAGKPVYCEWPLGNGLAEAEEMAALATARGVLGVVGTQARVAPEIEYLRRLIADGFVGKVLSSTLSARGRGWGASIEQMKTSAYLLDRANGATMLTIPFGHTLAALRDVLGEIVELSAVLANRRNSVIALDTSETLPMTAHDQVLVDGLLESGAPVSIHYRGGEARGAGLLWEINGSEGDICVTGPSGQSQLVQLSLMGGRGGERELRPLDVPASYCAGGPDSVVVGNVARVYARMAADLQQGTRTAPTFDEAVELHRVIAAVEAAAASGHRVSPWAS